MVMGPTHAMSGAAVGLAVAQILPEQWGGVTTAEETFIYAGLAAGAAMLPDLDAPSATVSRSFGPVTQVISRFTENIAQTFVNVTRGRKDKPCKNGHRTATHTIWAALAAGIGATALIGAFGKTAVIGLLFFLLGLGIRGLLPEWSKKTDWLIVTGLSAALAYAVWSYVPEESFGVFLGSAITVGCLTHMLGDLATKQGIPAFAPLLPFKGRRWWNLKLPKFLSIRANGPADWILLTGFTIAVIAQIGLVASGNMRDVMLDLLPFEVVAQDLGITAPDFADLH
ncbi:metal-dependent hydrolase [Corynebacterium vitaeruminis]|uniref:Metal-dependent hydrolase n=1 Tax=Corynebacterium vitaeruminis DSM 20294 TaxID=1224164 RepID=W5Y3H5_9CORY|nr:metal-dependent hydrolase [Corynebacterium vitaeruminis]AHI23439.1 hypothetical protein B843_10285 [Corynebacterium vitaeruminis DSM 20294]